MVHPRSGPHAQPASKDRRKGLAGPELDAVFDAFPVLLFVIGGDDRIVDFRAGRTTVLYAPPDSFLGRRVSDVLPDPPAGALLEAIARTRRLGSQTVLEYPLALGDASTEHFEARFVPLGDQRVAVLVTNITDRRQAEERLRQREEWYRALIERTADILAVIDGEGRVTFMTAYSAELMGFTADEMVGRPALAFVHPEDTDAVGQEIRHLAASPGQTTRLEVRACRRDGAVLFLDVLARSLVHVPTVAGIVISARDMTEQKRLEEQFRQAQKLESIGRLAGGVAHDFNNLLTVILGCAELLDGDIRAGRPNPEDVAEIRRAGKRAQELTAQLLTFARRQMVVPQIIDVKALVRDSEKLLGRILGEDVALVVRLAADLWSIKADPSQIQQVVFNLAVNARQAMPVGGHLTLVAANVAFDEEDSDRPQDLAPGEYIQLQVQDSGTGMPDQVRTRLFEPFFTTKPIGQGTGLGLATVYGIVKQNGGHIGVESAPGSGTTFTIYLPRTHESAQTAPGADVPGARQGSETILVVEDEPAVRELAVRALEQAGYQVLAASRGAEALDIAARTDGPIHLLLTDVVMPGMSGPQVAEALAHSRPDARTLFVSGYADQQVFGPLEGETQLTLLPKPFTPSALLSRVREVLDVA